MKAISRIVWQPGLPAAEPPWQELWQTPVFLLGLLALGGVLALSLLFPYSGAAMLSKELAGAREALESGHLEAARQRADAALQSPQSAPHLAGELHFVRGSATFLLAEAATGPEKTKLNAKALEDLRAAERLGVHRDRLPRLHYRLAVAEYLTGGDAEQAARRIDAVLEASPADRLAGYGLLVQLHLGKAKANLEAALKANERLLAQPDLTNPNPARLQRGELLLRRKDGAEARQVLARIPVSTPEYSEARHLRAWSHCQDGEFQAAIDLWEPALQAEDVRLPHLAQALFGLGRCYAQVGRPCQDVQTVWQRLEREAPDSEEAVAAAVELATLHVLAGQADDALAQFTLALRRMTPTWQNAYADAAEVRALLEKTLDAWMSASEFENARRLAQLSAAVALPGEASRRFALASQKAGYALLRQAERAESAQREHLAEKGRKLLREAGEAFETAVRELGAEGDSGELLWWSAENYLQAQEPARAAAVLEVYLRSELKPERKLEAQVALGEAYQALRRNQPAVDLLKQAAGHPGALQVRASYLLALAQMDLNQYAEAEGVLKQIMTFPLLDGGNEEFRLARFALVHVLFRREAFSDAADYLEKALEQDAQHPQAVQTRYWLAEAYRRAARQEKKLISAADTATARDFYLKRKQQQLERALEQFRLVVAGLEKVAETRLPADEATRLRDSRLGMGECLFNLGRYEEAAEVYRRQMECQGDSVAALTAAMHLTHCYTTLKQLDQAKATAARGRAILDRLADGDLEAAGSKRSAWQDWFDNAAASTQARNSQ
jgi:TolA-binding protein